MAASPCLSLAEWGYLVQHANGLAELALEQLATELDDAGAVPVEPMDAAGSEAAALALFANMNVTDHMDGLPWDSAEHDARVLTEAAQLAASPEPQPAALAAPATGPQAGDWLARVDDWLKQAYAAQATLALDVARFDQDKVAQLLAALPPGMTPLTGPLDAAAFDQWLNLWQAGEPVVLDLVGELLA